MTDLATGLYAHGAIMAALLQRNQTGKGQKINCDLLSTQVSTLVNLGQRFQKKSPILLNFSSTQPGKIQTTIKSTSKKF